MLITTWFDAPFRPTRDIDLLGFGSTEPDDVLAVFRAICGVSLDDGVEFDLVGLTIDHIREELEYGGLRIKTNARVGGARVRVVVDIGYGDAVEPEIAEIELPVLLDAPSPLLRAYPREAVIAEKFQAMVVLGRANSRMKDFYDIWVLCRAYAYADGSLARAIAATFSRRQTPIPIEPPDALTRAFAEDPSKRKLWDSFLSAIGESNVSLPHVVEEIAAFLMAHAAEARKL